MSLTAFGMLPGLHLDSPDGVDSMFEFELSREGEYRIDEDRRIAKRFALLEHAEASLAFEATQNLLSPQTLEWRRREIENLRPYWTSGVTKVEACAAFLADHPCSEMDDQTTDE